MAGVSKAGNQRRSRREKRRLKVRFWNDEFEATGFTADVSETGIFLVTTQSLDAGTRLHLELEVGDETYLTEGVVVRRKNYPRYARAMYNSGVGVRFVGLGEALTRAGGSEEAPEETAPQEAVEEAMCVDLRDLEELREVYERDVKHGGLLVCTAERPELNSEVVVPLLLPEPNGQIECAGTVVKYNDSPPGIALRLTEVDLVRTRLLEIIRSG